MTTRYGLRGRDHTILCDGEGMLARDAVERLTALTQTNADLLTELSLIIAGWETIERGDVRGRRLTDWETERLAFARSTILQARG